MPNLKTQITPPAGALILRPGETLKNWFESNIQNYRAPNAHTNSNTNLVTTQTIMKAGTVDSARQDFHFLEMPVTLRDRWKTTQRSRVFINSKLKGKIY